jgi:transposase
MAKAPTDPMTITSAVSPDLEAVGRFIREMVSKGLVVAMIAAVLALLSRMRDLQAEMVLKLHRQRHKHPPSETMRRLQLELPFLKEAPRSDPPATPKKKRKTRDPATRNNHGRSRFPKALERVVETISVPEAERICPRCHAQIKTWTYKVSEKLDVIPVRFIVKQLRREVGTCPCCREHVVVAPKPDEIVERGTLGTELIVQSLVDHYIDSVPLERIARNARAQGVPLAPQTLGKAIGRAIDLLDPIVRHITHKTLSSLYLEFDATSQRVLDAEHPLGVRTGALWGLLGEHRYVTFMAAPSGHADHLEKRLVGYTLTLSMCDGSETNNLIERAGARRGGCHAHARRKLVAAVKSGDSRAMEGLEIYSQIFAVDARAKTLGESPAQRLVRRQTETAPWLAKLREWLDRILPNAEPKSPLGIALRYLSRQWKRLTLFMSEALMELTNNGAERILRTHVLSRKTWFFDGHEENAKRTAAALTVVMTCKQMGIDPRCYLRDTMRRLLAGEKQLRALLPEHYTPALPAR